MISLPVINSCPTYHLKAAPHIYMSNTKPSIPEVRECPAPNTLEHMEDNLTPLSLLSFPDNIRKALQSVISSGELDLDEIDPDQVIMLETWIPVDAVEQNQESQLNSSRRRGSVDGLTNREKRPGRADHSLTISNF